MLLACLAQAVCSVAASLSASAILAKGKSWHGAPEPKVACAAAAAGLSDGRADGRTDGRTDASKAGPVVYPHQHN